MEDKRCNNCKEILSEVDDLRVELTEVRGKYSNICERLWIISNKKRFD